jgi:hypothetical protein
MRILVLLSFTGLALTNAISGQSHHEYQPSQSNLDPLDTQMAHFDVSGGILRDGISELSLKKVDGLHLGFEEIIKERTQDDPRAQSTHFSLHLDGKKVSDILDEVYNLDTRYTWSRDGGTVNVYPRASAEDPSYLLNLWIDNIAFEKIPVPDQALTPLSKLFPEQQVVRKHRGFGRAARTNGCLFS